MSVYAAILKNKSKGKKQFAVLLDPDKLSSKSVIQIAKAAENFKVDYFFVGGSLLINDNLNNCIKTIKKNCSTPVVLFPGNTLQISDYADGILFLSLISGRNAEMLIGRHVVSAPYIKASKLEVMPTGYMLIESGKSTAVSYMSYSTPIPSDKNDIAVCTAMAGELLGLKMIFMDAGSGAQNPVSLSMIQSVSKNISVPLIIGGGIKSPEKAYENCMAGADIVVVGNSIEKNSSLVKDISEAVHSIK